MSKKNAPEKGSTFTMLPKGKSKKAAGSQKTVTVEVTEVKPNGTVTVRKLGNSGLTVSAPRSGQYQTTSPHSGFVRRNAFKGRISADIVASSAPRGNKLAQQQGGTPKQQKQQPTRSLAETLAGRIGKYHSGGTARLSERAEEVFAEGMYEKRRREQQPEPGDNKQP